MAISSGTLPKGQKEKPSFLLEVANAEKQLWAFILKKGILHSDVQGMYHNLCSSYEKLILDDHELAELQDVEFSLWKLHYTHIGEFRKRMKIVSPNEEAKQSRMPQSGVATDKSYDLHGIGFKLFLSEASEFYQNCLIKLVKYNGLSEDFYRQSGSFASLEPKKMQKLQFLCHRFLVCLGDLARYREDCEQSDKKSHNWSASVTYYLEAIAVWPHGGNPQNQLAVLATYIGDDFLALYHCIRSLAIKEPFPDAWNNLIRLFERNQLSHFPSLSHEAQFDFLKPAENIFWSHSPSTTDVLNGKMVKAENEGLRETKLWPLLIRMISFFFIKSSLDDFPGTFASTVKELDELMKVDDAKFQTLIESYQDLGSAKIGPFRILQAVSALIFVIEDLLHRPEVKFVQNRTHGDHLLLTQMAVSSTFIFMGRLVDRCSKAKSLECCPVLPAILVFVEWLVTVLDDTEKCGCDDKSKSAMSYFFDVFVVLLKQLDRNSDHGEAQCFFALWEDYELRGFTPLANSQASLDFSSHWRYATDFQGGFKCRAHRIINAAFKMTEKSNNIQQWIFYDKSKRKFDMWNRYPYGNEVGKFEASTTASKVEEHHQSSQSAAVDCEKLIIDEKPKDSTDGLDKSIAMEEEEVILFKPLTRYNSAPLGFTSDHQLPARDTGDQAVSADECLRRAQSLLIAQNSTQNEPSSFHSDLTNFRRNKHLKKQEAHSSEASIFSWPPSFGSSIPAGPPSLSSWVLDRGSLSGERAKVKNDFSKHCLTPIEEMASASLHDLSIKENEDCLISPSHGSACLISPSHGSATDYGSPTYPIPVPSAPFLPDNDCWFNGIQSTFSDYGSSGNISTPNSCSDPLQVSGHANWTVPNQPHGYGHGNPGFIDNYSPMRQMTSSEWLRYYRESHNLERPGGQVWPVHSYNGRSTGNFHDQGISRSGFFYQRGTASSLSPVIYGDGQPSLPGFPLVYGSDQQRREKLFLGYQRPSPYGCGAVNEPEPLLQYLKEKEWLLEQDPTCRGPPYMGS
ncbi:hypothetical protein K2173_000741 [Erythroxylum novogranatense]|uniref:Protein SMG7L-like n=1 Tax=Erythroxylum novogranatense TaxID=1862640 RepID=A0AAV8T2T8_9ROSI|nr:hypothetical protein K2173_000741 [Erythroxylum novogranatense]